MYDIVVGLPDVCGAAWRPFFGAAAPTTAPAFGEAVWTLEMGVTEDARLFCTAFDTNHGAHVLLADARLSLAAPVRRACVATARTSDARALPLRVESAALALREERPWDVGMLRLSCPEFA